ncbi:MAG: hypothetical protein ABR507_02630 [Actinomycetota bacterium]|nr:hypothetical protein [Actinomycetota bacterium]
MKVADRSSEFLPRGFVVDWQLGTPVARLNTASSISRDHGVKVLLVTADADGRQHIGGWLSEEGHEVMECPGPSAPDYTCLGGRGKDCPLANAADVVVVDLNLASDAMLAGTPSWRLVDYYLGLGHPVVTIAGPNQMGRFFLDDRVVKLDRPVERGTLLAAIDYVSRQHSKVDQIGTLRLTPRNRGSSIW